MTPRSGATSPDPAARARALLHVWAGIFDAGAYDILAKAAGVSPEVVESVITKCAADAGIGASEEKPARRFGRVVEVR